MRGLRCCEPTWKDRPYASRPRRCACSSTRGAISGAQPNLRDSGHSAPIAVAKHAAEHFGARRGARDLLDFRLAIDGEEPHAELEGAENVALLLDRVAEGDAVGRRAGGERLLDLDHRGAVEAGAEAGEQRQHFRRRIGLDGIEHARVRQRLGEGGVIVAHDIEIDDEAGAVILARFAAVAQEFEDTIGHRGIPSKGGFPPEQQGFGRTSASRPHSRDGDARRGRKRASGTVRPREMRRLTVGCCAVDAKNPEGVKPSKVSAAFDWNGKSRSARPARKTSLFGKPAFGGPTETKKPGPSLL